MSQTICTNCGAGLIAGTTFCRQCGQPVGQVASPSEQITSTFGTQTDAVTTKRLDPRPTVPRYEIDSEPLSAAAASSPSVPWSKLITVGIVLLILVIGSLGVAWSLRSLGSANSLEISRSLVYPGSRTVVNVGDSGGAVLQLETPDAFDKVNDWYVANFKPAKTIRLTSSSVVHKKEKVTVTMVSQDKLTSIVIKQAR